MYANLHYNYLCNLYNNLNDVNAKAEEVYHEFYFTLNELNVFKLNVFLFMHILNIY